MTFGSIHLNPAARRERGSVLIIVLWISFGLVALALYFAHSMAFQMHAADNQVATMAAEQAVASGARSVSNLLATSVTLYGGQFGVAPYMTRLQCEAVPVGDAKFWLIGRNMTPTANIIADQGTFGIIDESSKLNLNTVTYPMLMMLPRMTPELAANIIAWRDATNPYLGADDTTYQMLTPSYHSKTNLFETVDELRLVYGATLDILYGEDANLNGILDPNENDGDNTAPTDNRDGRLDPGLLDYFTVWSKESLLGSDCITPKAPLDGSDGGTNLQALLEDRLGADQATAILRVLAGGASPSPYAPGGGAPGGTGTGGTGTGGTGTGGTANRGAAGGTATAPVITNLMQFYIIMKNNSSVNLTVDEFRLIEGDLIVSNNVPRRGLVNVNTAQEAVLSSIPGIGFDASSNMLGFASELVSQRQQYATTYPPSMAWVDDVLGDQYALMAGPYITGRSYQFTADVAAVGYYNRGFSRVKFIFDMAEGWPRIVYRQDLTHLGWALGQEVRRDLQLSTEKP